MIVLLALLDRQVLTEQFNSTALTGKGAIFARTAAPTETRTTVEIVGCYTTLDLATSAGERYATDHPGRRYQQRVVTLDDIPDDPVPTSCILCGIIVTGGLSYCPGCQQAHAQEMRERDPDWDKG